MQCENIYCPDNVRLAHWMACRYAWACERDRAISLEDLEQAAWLGITQAVGTFNPDASSWTTWAVFYMRKEIRKCFHFRKSKERPHSANWGAESLDAPLSEDDSDGNTLLDLLEDQSIADMGNEIEKKELRETVLSVAKDMPEGERTVVIQFLETGKQQFLRDGCGEMSPQACRNAWTRAKRHIYNKRHKLNAWIDLNTRYYSGHGLQTFRSTGTSGVERAVIWRLEREPVNVDTNTGRK